MKQKMFLLLAVCIVVSTPFPLGAWGIWGHNHINRGAVLALPKDMGMFFYNHIDFMTQESTIPDLRKYTYNDKAEFCRHYISLEKYNYKSRNMMPKTLDAAIAKYSMDSLSKFGMLPWYLQDMMAKLTTAFKNKRKTEILLLAGDIGHYIADAHMPLHTTVNSDGQQTSQAGIHSFWESQLPELFGKNYNLHVADGQYIKNIEQTTWDIIDTSNSLVYPLLYNEAKMRKDNPEDKQYVIGPDGKPTKNPFGQRVHAYEYAHVYHELLNGMVERQMRSAIRMTASFWYTAWVNAGKPDLESLDPDYITERNKPFYKQDIKSWQKGKIKGCASDKDY